MSETTSTNISVAQADSTDSIQAFSARHSQMTDPGLTKRICFYKSGDPRFNGIKMVVSNRSFKTFDTLLDSLSKKVPLPFGVRNITTPRGINHITSLEDLEDGKSYICSHQRKIKPINLERASKKPLLWQSSRPLSARRRAMQMPRKNEVTPFQRENTVVLGSSKNFVIFKNGDKEFKHSLVLNKKSVQSFDAFLDQISEAFQFPVYKLHSTDGRRILSTHALLLSSGTIVAAGREPFKPRNYESEREFLPAKLPGISQRVFPKSRSKSEMKSQVKTNEPVTIPSGQEHSLSSANVCNQDSNLVDFSHTPDNEIHLTEHWPNSGEDLPVISPGDNIEKSVHLNCDGTMTVEMKVRFKIREEETINWSTTVSRADLSYYKKKIFRSSVNPEVQTVSITDSPKRTSNIDNKTHDESKDSKEYRFETHTETVENEIQDNDINTDKYTTSSTRKEKPNFYRPPTPGIRRGQERRLSVSRASEVPLQENRKQMFSFSELEHESTQSVNDIVNHCNKQMLTTGDNIDSKSNGANLKETKTDHKNEENLSKLGDESFELLETTRMVYEKRVKKSDRSDYMCFTGASKRDRPYSAGKHMYHQDQFKLKEIKRSMSASITFSEPLTLHEGTTHATDEFELSHSDCLDTMSQGNVVTQMAAVPSTKFSGEAHSTVGYSSATSGDKIERASENGTCISNDKNSTSSMGQKKKKKKKILCDPLKHTHTNIPNQDKICLESPHIVCGLSCGGMIPETKNIMFEEIFPPQISSIANHSELDTVRKLKGDKQMAKVKPRSVKTNDKSMFSPIHNSEEHEEKKDNAKVDILPRKEIADYSGTVFSNGSILYTNDQAKCPVTEYNPLPDEIVPKKTTEVYKRSQKAAKKQKLPKKKTKNNRTTETKKTSASNSLDSENVTNSPTLTNALESYVQAWLNNIFPNAALPVLQLFSSTRSDGDATHSTTHSSNDSGTQPHAEANKLVGGEVCVNANGSQTLNRDEANQVGPIHTEPSAEKEMFIPHGESFDEDAVSAVIEKTEHLAELFAQQYTDFGHNTFCESNKMEELIKWMASHQLINVPPKKASTDAAVQVENYTFKKGSSDYIKCDCMGDVLAEQFKLSPQNINASKSRQLEKSFSLPNSPSKVGSSSSQLLLAWLIVLHLKQDMYHMVEGLSYNPNSSTAIFALLQSLKKIAITEKEDDLKAVILNLQESTLRFDSVMKNFPCVSKPIPMRELPKKSIESDQLQHMDVEDKTDTECIIEPCEKPDLLKNDGQNILNDDMDDLRFFATQPYRELSGEYCQNAAGENLEQCSLLEPQESSNNAATYLLEKVEEPISAGRENFEECPVNLSQKYTTSSMSNNNIGSDHNMETIIVSPKKVSKVKMMVQEMEQRKYSSPGSEHQKCLQSPTSSDWSDYRQDSEESMSDNLRASSEIMTESGEEQVHEKPFKTGYVKRAIERLYGKVESKIKLPKTPTYVSPINIIQTQPGKSPKNENNEYLSFSSQSHQCLSKESMSRSISRPSNKKELLEDRPGSLKSTSLPLLDTAIDHDSLIYPKSGSSPNNKLNKCSLNKDGHVKTDTGSNAGVLIDKGRWLLKENHLVRRSPPEITGMYANLDTTSADTFIDNTSDDVPYLHSAYKMNQPLAEVSSSELEDMAKPQHYTCHYFNMPHGSDSEPFNDAFGTKSKVRPKSSGTLVTSKTQDSVSLESIEKCGAISASLPSFATVDFHFSDNKVHPLPQPDGDGQPLNPTGTSQRQVKEQDSLDKLQFICGQNCPILPVIINPLNEEHRGFAYRRPYDIENFLLLHSMSTNTMQIPLLNNCPFVDDNNNIHYNNVKLAVNNCSDSDTNTSFIFYYKEGLGGVETFKNVSKGRQCLSKLYAISAMKIANTVKLYSKPQINILPQEVSCMGNDENNNILYYHT